MRIVYCYFDFKTFGGIEHVFLSKMNYWAEKMHWDVYALALFQKDGESNAFYTSPMVKQINCGIEDAGISLKNLIGSYRKAKKDGEYVNKIITDINPDILVTSTNNVYLLRILHIPESIKLIVESHFDKNYYWYGINGIKRWIRYAGMNNNIYKAKCLVTLTKSDATNWSGIRTEVIPNYADVIATNNYDSCSSCVVAVGRLVPQKGFELLLKAWKIVVDNGVNWKLRIGGDGPMMNRLNALVAEYELTEFVSFVSNVENVTEFYRNASLFVSSSIYEGFHLAMLEAMSCGLPCVAFDCPSGPADLVDDGINGFLVATGDVDKLAERIIFLINNKECRERMSNAARKKSLKFEKESIMKKWTDLFMSLVNS